MYCTTKSIFHCPGLSCKYSNRNNEYGCAPYSKVCKLHFQCNIYCILLLCLWYGCRLLIVWHWKECMHCMYILFENCSSVRNERPSRVPVTQNSPETLNNACESSKCGLLSLDSREVHTKYTYAPKLFHACRLFTVLS